MTPGGYTAHPLDKAAIREPFVAPTAQRPKPLHILVL